MNIENLFSHQRMLNKKLLIDENLNDYKITARMHLSIQIKISDLANSTNCFVYWKDAETNFDKDIILDKYIKTLNHLLTLGLDRGYCSLKEVSVENNEACLSDQFSNLFIDINDLRSFPSIDHYQTLLEDFLSLGLSLNLTLEEIETEFLNKTYFKIVH